MTKRGTGVAFIAISACKVTQSNEKQKRASNISKKILY